MTREVTEAGPRLAVLFSADELEGLEEGLNDAGYQKQAHPSEGERRYHHAGGSVVRIFPEAGHLYAYPPGGTRHQTGELCPFSPLKREVGDINARHAAAAGGGADDPPAQDEGGGASSSSSSSSSSDASTPKGDEATSTTSDTGDHGDDD